MVQLDFLNGLTGDKTLEVVEANEKRRYELPEGIADSSLSYELTLRNHSKILLNVYVVYSKPEIFKKNPGEKTEYSWKLVSRKYCKRGCKGPILRAIQRFGKLGKRCSEIYTHYNKEESCKQESSKDHRFLFISIDEACTHVSMGDKKCRFRLLFSVDCAKTGERIGSAVSAPIRVLANNDAPNGAAFIKLQVPLEEEWEGWSSSRQYVPSDPEDDVDAPTTPDNNTSNNNLKEALLRPRFVKRTASDHLTACQAKVVNTLEGPALKKAKSAGDIEPLKLAKEEKKLEGPQTPSPSSIETVRASMRNAIQSPWGSLSSVQSVSPSIISPIAYTPRTSSLESPVIVPAMQTPLPQQRNTFDPKQAAAAQQVMASPFGLPSALFSPGTLPNVTFNMPMMAYLQAFQQAIMIGNQMTKANNQGSGSS